MTTLAVSSRVVAAWVFAILLGSYAFFWHARDWNSASRLMLTYALVDRGTVSITGLEDQTRDRARYRGRYFTDKLPGFSLLAVMPTLIAKQVLGLPSHPLGRKGFAYWPTDYWATLGTSGLASALTGALLCLLAFDLGCGPRRAALAGLAYGLATSAYVYATLSYGHQASAFALLCSFALVWKAPGGRHPSWATLLAGGLAALAAVIELQVGVVSAVLGLFLLNQVLTRRLPPRTVVAFAAGALVPTIALLAYNTVAFESPWDMGYFHEDMAQFRGVHSRQNPLGLRRPDWGHLRPLLFGGYRGLFFYAPILLLALPGWIVLASRRAWGVALVSLAACITVLLVNLSYPEWTGGWSTGPRLLVPLLPFAMLAAAAALAAGGRATVALAVGMAVAGAALMLLFQGTGGRVPPDLADPLREVVWPLWRGDPPPLWREGQRFDRNLVAWALPRLVAHLPERGKWLQFAPLVAFQGLAISLLMICCRPPAGSTADLAESVRPKPLSG